MRLEDFLKYDDIVIQCHNVPDADALASGFAVYTYLKEHGKRPRLVYGGPEEIRKSNLRLMAGRLGIPAEHVRSIPEPDLLVTVDCQIGERNTLPPLCGWTEGHARAVIDHHAPSPSLQENHVDSGMEHIVSNYGSCSTVVWELLQDAGYSREEINRNRELATALYYGLFTDTGSLQEISHPADKDMRDSLNFSKSSVALFRNSNMSLEDLDLVNRALGRYDHHPDHRYAIIQAEPCDPNLLGVISDLMIEVDGIDTCAAFCMLAGGAKLSIRSCVNKTRADELAAYLCGGGGHSMKAGGFLPLPEKDAAMAGRILAEKMDDYFEGTDIYDARTDVPDLSDMRVYRKKRVKMGYVRGGDLLCGKDGAEGSRVLVRMLEGDFEIDISRDIMIMVGVEHDIYPCRAQAFSQRYDVLEEPYDYGEMPSGGSRKGYQPKIIDVLTGESRPFIPYIRSCMSRDTSCVHARQLKRRMKLFTLWDGEKYITGMPGDWFAVRMDESDRAVPKDVYIVKEDIFERLYSCAEEDRGD